MATRKKKPLGNNTKFASAKAPELKQNARFKLLDAAKRLLYSDKHRVRVCHEWLLPDIDAVEIRRSPDGKAHYTGLMTCGSVWACPVCARKISEKRRAELSDAVERARDTYLPVMVTYTSRHELKDTLPDLLSGTLSAYRGMKSRRDWRAIREEFAIAGSVRALEVTHGANGWHVHNHELIFVDMKAIGFTAHYTPLMFASDLREHITEVWTDALARYSMTASWDHGVDVTVKKGDIASYIAKFGRLPAEKANEWTLAHEVAKAPVKSGRAGSRAPFDLLADYAEGDRQAGALFVEYVRAFSGKSQLTWSRGLRDLLGMGKAEGDQDLSSDTPDAPAVLAVVPREIWKGIVRAGMIGIILDAANNISDERFIRWFSQIRAAIEYDIGL